MNLCRGDIPKEVWNRMVKANPELGVEIEDKPKVIKIDGRYRSKLERDYSKHLEYSRTLGVIRRWWYESMTWRLADGVRFTPDFVVEDEARGLQIHETKGFMRDDARLKLKWAAQQMPWPVFLVRRERQGWNVERVEA